VSVKEDANTMYRSKLPRPAIRYAVLLTMACVGAACSSPAGPQGGATQGTVVTVDGTVLMTQDELLTQDPTDLGMDALFRGIVERDAEGCLRLESGQTAIWPSGYDLVSRDGVLTVVDDEGKVVGDVGGEFRLGGGEMADLDGVSIISDDVQAVAEERCPGRYWLVSPGT
jgi:hypothetical protein